MRLAKIGVVFLILLIFAAVGASIFFRDRAPFRDTSLGGGSRQPLLAEQATDDLSVSQEVRTLTTRLRQQEQENKRKQDELEQQLRDLRSSQASAKNEANSNLRQEVRNLNEVNNSLKQQNDALLAQIKQQQDQQALLDKRIKEVESKPVTPSTDLPNIKTMIADELKKMLPSGSTQTGESTGGNLFTDGGEGINATPLRPGSEAEPATPPGDGRVHIRPYSASSDGPSGNVFTSGGNIFNGSGAGQGANTQQPQQQTVWPVYTLPVTTMLNGAVTLTPLVGRVPVGGNVNDPFKFQVELGAANLAANGHRIPGVAKVIAAGTVIGNREQSCVRGSINVLTFIFADGRIHTVDSGNNNSAGGGLGYLADPWGKPCIRGEYINNGSEYLSSRAGAAFLEGLANAYGNTQLRRTTDSNGLRETYISGNTYQYAASQGISSTAAEIADYVRERAMDAFDVIYVPQAQKVQIILEQQVNIDYDMAGRKVSYAKETRKVNHD